MQRRALVAASLAVLTALAGGLPGWIGPTAAASCSSWTSEADPPPTIRVFRHVSGVVETVDFRAYTKNVLSREWIGSWTAESLRSGALAVKHYAWYQILHWRGGVNSGGECFDLRDDTYDQVYDPSKPTWSSAAAAVDATWTTRVLKNGAIFPTYYNAGAVNEACAANANGWKMWQWGTQGCGLAGRTAAEIVLLYYYPGVTVTDAPAPVATPTPSAPPTGTPQPTATASASQSATPEPSASTTAATPQPTPQPTPLPTPPPAAELPGGGQTGLQGAAAPPAAPPGDPDPVVARAEAEAPTAATFRGVLAAWELDAMPRSRHLEWLERGWRWAFAWPDNSAIEVAGFVTEADALDPRLVRFRLLWGPATQRLLTSLSHGMAANGEMALRLLAPGS